MTARKELNVKDLCIDLLDIAHINFLSNLQGLKPGDVNTNAHPEINTIKTIVRHCSRQMDRTVETYIGSRITKDKKEYSFEEIVDLYLQISDTFFEMLMEFPLEAFNDNPGGTGEILNKRIQRIALHYLGHTGQIVLIRKMLGRGISGAYGFVKALSVPTRKKLKKEWLAWWMENKKNFADV
jgi:hypothetical protein